MPETVREECGAGEEWLTKGGSDMDKTQCNPVLSHWKPGEGLILPGLADRWIIAKQSMRGEGWRGICQKLTDFILY